MGIVKESITESVISYERKGIDAIEVRNCARQLWFSNEDVPIKLSIDDRRWVAVQASKDMPETGTPEHEAYFKSVKDWIDDMLNVRSFYDFLKTRDITDWNPDHRPITSFYTDLQQLNIDRVDSWLVEQLESGTLPAVVLAHDLVGVFGHDNFKPTTKWVTKKMQRHEGEGVSFPENPIYVNRRKGRAIRFDKNLLRRTLVRKGLMQPLFVDDDDNGDS